ncbi:FixH family protein [Paenibacillus whitsoniae]|uniref:YtkA-like domain-containing protein n=1 Tax=Paenibacillus whitsoniae TaxID=2496558 RepID=A0A3S0CEL7_9BACL|nr:FixH family protein [Paenibacillus whitsoniae]RTE10994.1 hypothetical protein EJQ19_04475 [Paenibacillus whitsoniae]
MKRWIVGASLSLLFLLTACQNSDMSDMDMGDMQHGSMKMIDVELKVSPEAPKENEQVTLQATVTQEGVPVKKVSELTFEIWNESLSTPHEKVKAVKKEDGVYTIDKKFAAAGTYHVITHTTASGIHTMPAYEFKVTSAH